MHHDQLWVGNGDDVPAQLWRMRTISPHKGHTTCSLSGDMNRGGWLILPLFPQNKSQRCYNMFSKQLNLKSKKVYEKSPKEKRSDPDQLITVTVQITSNHDIESNVRERFTEHVRSALLQSS